MSDFTKRGIVSASVVSEVGVPVRYIWCRSGRNNLNNAGHYNEIEAYSADGTNLALGKLASYNGGSTWNTGSKATNGNRTDYQGGTTMMIDLGEIMNVSQIGLWHYWQDQRVYYSSSVDISVDKSHWTRVYYAEITPSGSAEGIQIPLSNPEGTEVYRDIVRTREIVEY